MKLTHLNQQLCQQLEQEIKGVQNMASRLHGSKITNRNYIFLHIAMY